MWGMFLTASSAHFAGTCSGRDRFGYPVRLPGGSILVLPLRRLPDGQHALASFIANQASHAVVEALVGHMAVAARALQADLVVGLPTLGLVFGAAVAERLGHSPPRKNSGTTTH
jgi:hypothetical protein